MKMHIMFIVDTKYYNTLLEMNNKRLHLATSNAGYPLSPSLKEGLGDRWISAANGRQACRSIFRRP